MLGQGVTDVPSLLRHARLQQYETALFEQGFDDLQYMLTAGLEFIDELAACVSMKPGHTARLKAALRDMMPPVEEID